jgi:DNA-binding NarL/FixJ family response regulator
MILVICTHIRLYREALSELLGREPDVEVRGQAGSADDCIRAASGSGAEMVLVDADAPDALETVVRLRGVRPAPVMVVLGLPEDEDVLLGYAEAGVSAYVTREESLGELVATLRAAARGDLRCSAHAAGILVRHVAKLAAELDSREPAAPPVHLTRRELEIAVLMDAGLPNKQIASRLQIELPTVKNHVHHILDKLDVRRRGEATAMLRARGLIG